MDGRRFRTKLLLNYGTGESFYEGSTGYITEVFGNASGTCSVIFDNQKFIGDYLVHDLEKYLDIESENFLNDEDLII